ncbi:MAG: ISLre2 family transposase, partial [Dialister sp.]|nr:ISLre2 family transposase [Dialister sp.]
YMVWVLTARKTKTLTQALLYHANGKSYKKMDRAMHKAAVQAERRIAKNKRREAQKRKMRNYRPGCLEGRIGIYGASFSPMGRLARAIQKY